FEVFGESEQIREALLNDLIKDGLITHRALEVPVDPHPGQRGKPLTPCLFFSVYDEQQVWCMDSEAQRTETTTPVDDATLLPEAAAEVEENSEKLMPPWSPLMDVVRELLQDLHSKLVTFMQNPAEQIVVALRTVHEEGLLEATTEAGEGNCRTSRGFPSASCQAEIDVLPTTAVADYETTGWQP
ncbi:unnamed protein product, partial [Cladocopium goreaui]